MVNSNTLSCYTQRICNRATQEVNQHFFCCCCCFQDRVSPCCSWPQTPWLKPQAPRSQGLQIHATTPGSAFLFLMGEGSHLKRSLFLSKEAENIPSCTQIRKKSNTTSPNFGFSDMTGLKNMEKIFAKSRRHKQQAFWLTPREGETNLLRNMIAKYLMLKVKFEQVPV